MKCFLFSSKTFKNEITLFLTQIICKYILFGRPRTLTPPSFEINYTFIQFKRDKLLIEYYISIRTYLFFESLRKFVWENSYQIKYCHDFVRYKSYSCKNYLHSFLISNFMAKNSIIYLNHFVLKKQLKCNYFINN